MKNHVQLVLIPESVTLRLSIWGGENRGRVLTSLYGRKVGANLVRPPNLRALSILLSSNRGIIFHSIIK